MQVLHDWIVVEPHYDSDKLGSLYLPRAFENPEAQQGIVIDAGPDCEWEVGTLLAFHPFCSHVFPTNKEWVYIDAKDVVCSIEDGIPMPRYGEAMIRPDWDSKYNQKQGLIYIPIEVSDDQYAPVMFGTIALIHYGKEHNTPLRRGDYVVIPPRTGSEIGSKDGVLYFVPIKDILAKVNHANGNL